MRHDFRVLRILAVLALAIATLAFAAPAQSAGPYPAKIETVSTIEVRLDGQFVASSRLSLGGSASARSAAARMATASGYVAFVDVASGVGTPPGSARVHVPGRATVTVQLTNGKAQVQVPSGLVEGQNYTATTSYVPAANSNYAPSSATTTFRFGGGQGGPVATTGGALPNTGGPSLGWLWTALLMLFGGTALVWAGRRNQLVAVSAH